MQLYQLDPDSLAFPPVEYALSDPNGLLAYGGDLSPHRILSAYQRGIFPWFNADNPILWWSPDPRAVLRLDQLHLSHSMKKFLRRGPYTYTLNTQFAAVIRSCADTRPDATWIHSDIQQAYLYLHQRGIAHSVEVWQQDKLVGGLYGIALGAMFCGESMFSLQDNASKCALFAFCQHFSAFGGQWIDCQILNPHTASLGAREIPRSEFLSLLAQHQSCSLPPSCWHPQALSAIYPPESPSGTNK